MAGGICSPEALWQCLLEKRDTSGEIPATRWAPYHGRGSQNARVLEQITKRGYFVEDIENFDCNFFGISPKEAEQMDPQQRVSLEVVWEALEDAGIPAESLRGTNAAVFWGMNSADFSHVVLDDLPAIDAWMGIGTAYCGVPNRISHNLELIGPSMAIDAACASSLVALHYGARAIVENECQVALIGGVNMIGGPGLTRVLDVAGVTSADGRCRSFDDDAAGYGRGEGAGAVVLKNLAQAIQDGDHIHAVVKGSAVGHNGKTPGIMAPSPRAQEMVARSALRAARDIDAHSIRYVEAHATSTKIGDPAELSAIAAVYGAERFESTRPCYIGSVKPNIGHLEAGAGVLGLIKAILTVEKGVLAPQANLDVLNSSVDWNQSGLQVVREPMPWPDKETPRRAAVCSYGYGGTVSHAIVEEAPHEALPPSIADNEVDSPGPHMILFSSPQKRVLATIAKSLQQWLMEEKGQLDMATICHTLAMRRSHHAFRAALTVTDIKDAIHILECMSNGSRNPWVTVDRVLESTPRQVLWVFSGHGAQWAGMAKELIGDCAFQAAVQPLDDVAKREIGQTPTEWLQEEDWSSDKVQILTYMVQIGVSAVLHARGVFPQAVLGHSVGEIAASVVAGALTPREGMLIVTRRSVLCQSVMGQGGMVVINRPFAEVHQTLGGRADVVAAIDTSPRSCVISGTKEAVERVGQEYSEQGVDTFTVRTDIAFHSPLVHTLRESVYSALHQELRPTQPSIKLYSTSLADPRGQNLRDAHYWVGNLALPVRLTSSVRAAIEDGYRVFMEISAHPIVAHSIGEIVQDSNVDQHAVIPTLRRGQNAERCILQTIGRLHCTGVTINWGPLSQGAWTRAVPKYTWAHNSLLRTSREKVARAPVEAHDLNSHTLLGRRLAVAGTSVTAYSTVLDVDSKPFPGSHPVMDSEIVPAACLINTFLGATDSRSLQEVDLRSPVVIDSPRQIQVVVDGNTVKLMSRLVQDVSVEGEAWVTHTSARTGALLEASEKGGSYRVPLAIKHAQRLENDFTIKYLAGCGVSAMGFPWAVLEHHANSEEMLARVDVVPDSDKSTPSSWAPFIDAATSIGSTFFYKEPGLRMPAHIARLDVFTDETPAKSGWVYVEKDAASRHSCHVYIANEQGMILLKLSGMRFSGFEGTRDSGGSIDRLLHRVAWPPAHLAESPITINQIVVVSQSRDRMDYAQTLHKNVRLFYVSTPDDLKGKWPVLPLDDPDTAVVFIPDEVPSLSGVSMASEHFAWQLLQIVQFIVGESLRCRVFALTMKTAEGATASALAHSSLVGLSRILASEHPDQFGGMIDHEESTIPLTTMRYVQGADIVRIRDGVARTARLRHQETKARHTRKGLTTRPEGTYVITGGLGALGLPVAEFLADCGAKRLVLVSRRGLPPRSGWCENHELHTVTSTIRNLEKRGIAVHTVPLDISVSDAAGHLTQALERLGLPPVLGIVHAAGVLENQLVIKTTKDALRRVLAPKVNGALALHEAFPPNTLDFFVCFSSCGQLFGFPGQSTYASANSFLDTLATHRRGLGDNAISIQWTAWRGMGMGSDSDFVQAELHGKGITDVTRYEAFLAWLYLAQHDVDHGVVVRSRLLDAEKPLPTPILTDVAVRCPVTSVEKSSSKSSHPRSNIPVPEPERTAYLDQRTRECVAKVLHFPSEEDVDGNAVLADLGLDSVMGATLRQKLQQTFQVIIPPTLFWSQPTVTHLVRWLSQNPGH